MQHTIYYEGCGAAEITPPLSKSITNRALVISAVSGGAARLSGAARCDDSDTLGRLLSQLPEVMDAGAAGTAMRFATAYAAATPGRRTLTGTERMKRRPIGPLVDALRQMGADITYAGAEGYPPLAVCGGRLHGGRVAIPADVSSQYISALLLIAPGIGEDLEIALEGTVASKPYIDLTIGLMNEAGASARWTPHSTIKVEARPYRPCTIDVEGDWSAASYFYEAAALSKAPGLSITLNGLRNGSMQGDSVVAAIFRDLGVDTAYTAGAAVLSRNGRRAERLDYDFSHCPDIAQTLAATCCAMGVPFRFTGLASLKIKETDRIEALSAELLKLGFHTAATDSTLEWDGTAHAPSSLTIDTYEDHRMAMAFAPMAAVFPGIRVEQPGVVSKSYPGFWRDLAAVGYRVAENTGAA